MASSCFDDLAGSFEEKSRSQDPDTVFGGDEPDSKAREPQDRSRPDCTDDADVVWDGWEAAFIRSYRITKIGTLGKREFQKRQTQ